MTSSRFPAGVVIGVLSTTGLIVALMQTLIIPILPDLPDLLG